MKVDVCGATTTGTLAKAGATAVKFSVKKMTAKDQCTFMVTSTCDLPTVELKTATGNFLKPE